MSFDRLHKSLTAECLQFSCLLTVAERERFFQHDVHSCYTSEMRKSKKLFSMIYQECVFDTRVLWCLGAAVFWIIVIAMMQLILRRIERSHLLYIKPWLPRLDRFGARKQRFNDIYPLNGHLNTSSLKQESPTPKSNILTFKEAKLIYGIESNAKALKCLVNVYHKNLTYATGLTSNNGQLYVNASHDIKTNLKSLLSDKNTRFTRRFIFSLIDDLTSGLCYLHNSPIEYHGELNSMNCVITSSMELKISDFSMYQSSSDRFQQEPFDPDFYELWLAPELLRGKETQKSSEADIYAYSILVHEIIHRKGPFNIYASQQCPRAILDQIRNAKIVYDKYRLYRPLIEESADLECGCPREIRQILEEAWSDDPAERPPIDEIYRRLSTLKTEYRKQQMDESLEAKETSRKIEMLREKKATCEKQLYRLVPSIVANSLMSGIAAKPKTFDSVSILFIHTNVTLPEQHFCDDSNFLRDVKYQKSIADLNQVLDVLTHTYDLYKVQYIKEFYVVASGKVASSSGQDAEVALFALHFLSIIQSDEIKHKFGDRISIKMGIHTGEVAAGLIGLMNPRYCVFGDSMNMAARLCTTSDWLKIQISCTFNDALRVLGGFESCERGSTHIKGRGSHQTHWLIGTQQPFRKIRGFSSLENQRTFSNFSSRFVSSQSQNEEKKLLKN